MAPERGLWLPSAGHGSRARAMAHERGPWLASAGYGSRARAMAREREHHGCAGRYVECLAVVVYGDDERRTVALESGGVHAPHAFGVWLRRATARRDASSQTYGSE
jgi:hypothetical protein